MNLIRRLAVLILSAGFSGGAAAQQRVLLDDEVIFVAVEEALHAARALASADITVRSQDGFITLSGTARTMEDIATAGRLAARVHGVTGVNNQIRVAYRPLRA